MSTAVFVETCSESDGRPPVLIHAEERPRAYGVVTVEGRTGRITAKPTESSRT